MWHKCWLLRQEDNIEEILTLRSRAQNVRFVVCISPVSTREKVQRGNRADWWMISKPTGSFSHQNWRVFLSAPKVNASCLHVGKLTVKSGQWGSPCLYLHFCGQCRVKFKLLATNLTFSLIYHECSQNNRDCTSAEKWDWRSLQTWPTPKQQVL